MIPEPFIEEIRNSTDLVALISQSVELKPAGKDYAGLCPFHTEKTPSFTVSPSKHFFNCFGCGAHGSAIDFLMQYEHLSFPDAIHTLAARLGFTVPNTPDDPAARQRQTQAQLESALNHELLVLLQVIQGRVNSRILGKSKAVLPPEYRPTPDSHWQRENLAAKRIQRSLSLLYSGGTA